MPDLAVIMSIYINDRSDYVREAIESILTQTYSDFHLYIAFDGPVSIEVDKYITTLNDKRIKLFRIEKNGGLAGALNILLEKLLENPVYELIARMDADDISKPSRFQKQRDFLMKNSEIACVGSWYEDIDENGKHLAFRKLPVDHQSLRKRYYTRTPFAHPSVMYSRSLIEVVGFYPLDTILMEDNVLWGKALVKGLKFANIPEFLLKFRKDESFYKRRSGIKYGWNFFLTRSKIIRSLNLPAYTYFMSFCMGILKMMPSSMMRAIYQINHKFV